MYCTLSNGPVSTGIGIDAGAAYHRLRRQARTLATISHSFDVLAATVTSAYSDALAAPTTSAWTAFVTNAAELVEHACALSGIIDLDAEEHEALAFFRDIVRENADLLGDRIRLGNRAAKTEVGPIATSPRGNPHARRRSPTNARGMREQRHQ
jgi:hypothetical protein